MNETSLLPFSRDVARASIGAQPAPALLTPVVQTGPVDVSDLLDLPPVALRKALVARARALLPLLERNAAATEANRRVADENIAAIRAAGLFKIMVPRRFGGLETDIRTKLEVSRELAKGCGSTAWVTTLLNVCSWFAGLGSAALQEDIWGRQSGSPARRRVLAAGRDRSDGWRHNGKRQVAMGQRLPARRLGDGGRAPSSMEPAWRSTRAWPSSRWRRSRSRIAGTSPA